MFGLRDTEADRRKPPDSRQRFDDVDRVMARALLGREIQNRLQFEVASHRDDSGKAASLGPVVGLALGCHN